MQPTSTLLEILRWGYVHLPCAVLFYAKELDLDMEDIGVLAAIFYAFENTRPLFQSGVRTGQVLHGCPNLSTNKFSRRLQKLVGQEIIEMIDAPNKHFTEKIILLEPLMQKLEHFVLRDHPELKPVIKNHDTVEQKQLEEYRGRIKQLEQDLEEQKNRSATVNFSTSDLNFKKVADFIAKKTGNLLSVKMESELQKWLLEYEFTPEFLLCILELAFERKITNPRDITKIVHDIQESGINKLDGLETYFRQFKDLEKNIRGNQFDPDVLEFGKYTGLDMNADARRNMYNKWKYDWGFSHQLIMKAGELMCQRTKNGGLEYIDSILNNWLSKEVRTLGDVDKEVSSFKNRAKPGKSSVTVSKNTLNKRDGTEFEFYVPPEILAELKSKV
jgi:DnaD/phage-associated family protein